MNNTGTITLRGVERIHFVDLYAELEAWQQDGHRIISDAAALTIMGDWESAGFIPAEVGSRFRHGHSINAGDLLQTVLRACADALKVADRLQATGPEQFALVALAAWIGARLNGYSVSIPLPVRNW